MKIMIPHVMRKLSFSEKEKFLVDTLSIPESKIKKIRSIPDTEKRMIEAARLQWEMFKDIHGDITAWLSGFSHESRIRARFGSHFKLRAELGLLPNPIHGIEFSQEDLRRRVYFPEEITPELAEETGIHIGDGSMWEKRGSFWFVISGDLKEESLYHKGFVARLLEKLYGLKPRFKEVPSHTEIRTIIKSRASVEFKHKFLDLPMGEKSTSVSIPSKIKESDFSLECLRGIFDTDGHLGLAEGGSLSIITASKKLFFDIQDILKSHSFDFWKDEKRKILRLRKLGTIKFLEEIGLHSIKHHSKFLLWKEFGSSPSRTHVDERLAVLKGIMGFEDLVKISEERKAPERGIST